MFNRCLATRNALGTHCWPGWAQFLAPELRPERGRRTWGGRLGMKLRLCLHTRLWACAHMHVYRCAHVHMCMCAHSHSSRLSHSYWNYHPRIFTVLPSESFWLPVPITVEFAQPESLSPFQIKRAKPSFSLKLILLPHLQQVISLIIMPISPDALDKSSLIPNQPHTLLTRLSHARIWGDSCVFGAWGPVSS